MDEDTQALLTADFEIGHYIRERIVPRAVLFFTGEALDDEDFEEEEGEEGGLLMKQVQTCILLQVITAVVLLVRMSNS